MDYMWLGLSIMGAISLSIFYVKKPEWFLLFIF